MASYPLAPRPEGAPLPLSLVRALIAAGYTPADLNGPSFTEAKKLLASP